MSEFVKPQIMITSQNIAAYCSRVFFSEANGQIHCNQNVNFGEAQRAKLVSQESVWRSLQGEKSPWVATWARNGRRKRKKGRSDQKIDTSRTPAQSAHPGRTWKWNGKNQRRTGKNPKTSAKNTSRKCNTEKEKHQSQQKSGRRDQDCSGEASPKTIDCKMNISALFRATTFSKRKHPWAVLGLGFYLNKGFSQSGCEQIRLTLSISLDYRSAEAHRYLIPQLAAACSCASTNQKFLTSAVWVLRQSSGGKFWNEEWYVKHDSEDKTISLARRSIDKSFVPFCTETRYLNKMCVKKTKSQLCDNHGYVHFDCRLSLMVRNNDIAHHMNESIVKWEIAICEVTNTIEISSSKRRRKVEMSKVMPLFFANSSCKKVSGVYII